MKICNDFNMLSHFTAGIADRHAYVFEANGAKHSLCIKDGELRMGGKEFRAKYIVKWQKAIWDLALKKEESHKKAGQGSVSPTVSCGLCPFSAQAWRMDTA